LNGFDFAQVDRLLTTTRSVRKRLDLERPVEPAVILECLRLATYAPNASNMQKWRWIVVADAEKRRAVGAIYRDAVLPSLLRLREERLRSGDTDRARISGSTIYLAEHLGEAPVLVLACIERALYGPVAGPLTLGEMAALLGSIYPAVWSFQLALRSRGLGSTFTTAHLSRADEVAALLDIPESYVQTCLLPVAYTKGADFAPAKRQPATEVVFWDHWGKPPK
jgi:nitroreductase